MPEKDQPYIPGETPGEHVGHFEFQAPLKAEDFDSLTGVIKKHPGIGQRIIEAIEAHPKAITVIEKLGFDMKTGKIDRDKIRIVGKVGKIAIFVGATVAAVEFGIRGGEDIVQWAKYLRTRREQRQKKEKQV